MDAGFVHVVETEQYFMTKDTQEQFFAWRCREYTLPRNEESSQAKGWIQENTRIGPVLEVTTSCLHGGHGIEIRIWSLSGDNCQSSAHGENVYYSIQESNLWHFQKFCVQVEWWELGLASKQARQWSCQYTAPLPPSSSCAKCQE